MSFISKTVRALGALCMTALLAACGGTYDDATVAQILASPDAPTGVRATIGGKEVDFTWAETPGATGYAVFMDPDGAGPAPSVQVGTVTGASFSYDLGLLPLVINSTFSVRACNAAGCSAESVAVAIDPAAGIIRLASVVNEPGYKAFGASLALSRNGDTLAVGAVQEPYLLGDGDTDNSPAIGYVQVYTRSAGAWVLQTVLRSGSAYSGEKFGYALAISDDGNTLAVGTKADGAYVFTRIAGVWSQQARLLSSNFDTADQFGHTLALSADGNTLSVGATREASNATGINGNQADNSAAFSGAVYVFVRSSGSWSQQAYVKSSDGVELFGASIALSASGDTMAVGASDDFRIASGSTPGAVYLFVRSGSSWSQQSVVRGQSAVDPDSFGAAVTLSDDGNTLAVGAPAESSEAGAAYLFTRSSGTWSQQTRLVSNTTGRVDTFGAAVALSGDGKLLAVGAYGDSSNAIGINGNSNDQSATSTGAAYLFTLSTGNWTRAAYLKADRALNTNSDFGHTLALSRDGRTLGVGAASEGITGGAVYMY